MHFGLITLFPAMFDALSEGITGQALKKHQLSLQCFNPRDYTEDTTHYSVDGRPFGGGPGMVLQYQPVVDAIKAAKRALGDDTRVIYLTPTGRTLNQTGAKDLSQSQGLILLCGRYEGIDERLMQGHVDECWSVGDYVLSGGELPAMTVIDAIIRTCPGVLGNQQSAQEDSFMTGLLDYPHYPHPRIVDKKAVPTVLFSGNHARIARWRLKQALGRTWQYRPDLLACRTLSDTDTALLDEYITEHSMGEEHE